MSRLVIHYRPSLFEEELSAALDAGFICTPNFTDLQKGDVVISRYTVLPFHEDVYREYENIGVIVANDIKAHRFCADIFRWYPFFQKITPKTWNQYDLAKLPENRSYVLKGETNSKKAYWNTHMFAENKKEAINVFSRLVDDGLVGNQQIAIREYVPLKLFMYGINGMPITKEFRYFFLGDQVVSRGFYWQNYVDELLPDNYALPEEKYSLKLFIDHIAETMAEHTDFSCVDIAQTQSGDWIVVEVNDGSMAGLSCIDPKEFYRNLYELSVERFNL